MSIFNQWDPARYLPDAFARFTASSDLDLGTARGLMWAAQLVYEIDITMSPRSLEKVKAVALWHALTHNMVCSWRLIEA